MNSSGLRLIVVEDARALGVAGADEVEAALRAEAKPVFGVATGSTPIPVYEELARRGAFGRTPVSVFGLDEYVGLGTDHPQSYHSFLRSHVTAPLGIDPRHVHLPDGNAHDLSEASTRYEQLMHSAGGISVQVLGIGRNGHIGFNEPRSSHSSRTRVVRLSDKTRHDNARFFEQEHSVPRQAITQGIGTILGARKLVLIAEGTQKASALAAALEGPVTTDCPASAVRLHKNVVVIADAQAAAELSEVW